MVEGGGLMGKKDGRFTTKGEKITKGFAARSAPPTLKMGNKSLVRGWVLGGGEGKKT
jgi:hypothetical protein